MPVGRGGSPFLRWRPAALFGTEAGELHAHVVQTAGGGGILRLPGRSLDLSVDEILSAQIRYGRRRDQEDRRLRPFRGTLEKHPDEPEGLRALPEGEVRLDDARMDRVHGDAGPRESPPVFHAEQDLGELRLPVRLVPLVRTFTL